MATLSLQFARSFPASAPSQQLSSTEICVLLITLAAFLCLSVCAPIERQHQSLDERAMLSAMLAAGGMPLVYSPPALCTAPNRHSRFDQSEMRTLFQN
jgi:hypothetical protein